MTLKSIHSMAWYRTCEMLNFWVLTHIVLHHLKYVTMEWRLHLAVCVLGVCDWLDWNWKPKAEMKGSTACHFWFSCYPDSSRAPGTASGNSTVPKVTQYLWLRAIQHHGQRDLHIHLLHKEYSVNEVCTLSRELLYWIHGTEIHDISRSTTDNQIFILGTAIVI